MCSLERRDVPHTLHQRFGLRVSGLGLGAWGLGFRASGFWLRALGLGFGVWGLGFGDSGFGLRFSGVGSRVEWYGLALTERRVVHELDAALAVGGREVGSSIRTNG